MSDETEIRSGGAPDRPGHLGGSSGEQPPLQARAASLKNRSREFVPRISRGTCARDCAQRGFDQETQEATERERDEKQNAVLTLDGTIRFLGHCRQCPLNWSPNRSGGEQLNSRVARSCGWTNSSGRTIRGSSRNSDKPHTELPTT